MLTDDLELQAVITADNHGDIVSDYADIEWFDGLNCIRITIGIGRYWFK